MGATSITNPFAGRMPGIQPGGPNTGPIGPQPGGRSLPPPPGGGRFPAPLARNLPAPGSLGAQVRTRNASIGVSFGASPPAMGAPASAAPSASSSLKQQFNQKLANEISSKAPTINGQKPEVLVGDGKVSMHYGPHLGKGGMELAASAAPGGEGGAAPSTTDLSSKLQQLAGTLNSVAPGGVVPPGGLNAQQIQDALPTVGGKKPEVLVGDNGKLTVHYGAHLGKAGMELKASLKQAGQQGGTIQQAGGQQGPSLSQVGQPDGGGVIAGTSSYPGINSALAGVAASENKTRGDIDANSASTSQSINATLAQMKTTQQKITAESGSDGSGAAGLGDPFAAMGAMGMSPMGMMGMNPMGMMGMNPMAMMATNPMGAMGMDPMTMMSMEMGMGSPMGAMGMMGNPFADASGSSGGADMSNPFAALAAINNPDAGDDGDDGGGDDS